MTQNLRCIQRSLRTGLVLFAAIFLTLQGHSQKVKVDSLNRLLATEKTDTGRARLTWQIADAISRYSLDSALYFAQEGLYMARKIQNKEGESRSLGILANTFRKMGNYPRALELNFEKLKLEEKRQDPRNLSGVLMNIGIVYIFQEEYRLGLKYYWKADSVINKLDVTEFKYNIALNIGDAYDRLNVSDSALIYFNKALSEAKVKDKDRDFATGKSMIGLGHSFRKLGSYQQSQDYYRNGIAYSIAANDEENICEADLGLAKLFRLMKRNDSSDHYANQSLTVAKKGGFLSLELEAAEFMTEHFKTTRNVDSAFAFISYVQDLNDSVNSKDKIRQLQALSSDEQFRQRQLEEDRRNAQKERLQQLQLMLIAVFIPALFLITLLLSRVRIHTKAIRLLGVLSLLFLFEYLTLLLHPTVARLTNHSPVLEILIFVVIAAILIPTHHRLEHWLIRRLSHHRPQHHSGVETEPVKAGNKKSPY